MKTSKNFDDENYDWEPSIEYDLLFEETVEPRPHSAAWRRIEKLKEKKRLREQLGSLDDFSLD